MRLQCRCRPAVPEGRGLESRADELCAQQYCGTGSTSRYSSSSPSGYRTGGPGSPGKPLSPRSPFSPVSPMAPCGTAQAQHYVTRPKRGWSAGRVGNSSGSRAASRACLKAASRVQSLHYPPLTLSPRSPWKPTGPGKPLGPGRPGGPGSPDTPTRPWGPGDPGSPRRPGKPGRPWGPGKPAGPAGPGRPAGPCNPSANKRVICRAA